VHAKFPNLVLHLDSSISQSSLVFGRPEIFWAKTAAKVEHFFQIRKYFAKKA
jgi:hypothetical protein